MLTRRQFLKLASVLPVSHWPSLGRARTSTTVAVVGGGFGGATCAKYLRKLDPSLRVVLITPHSRFVTCPFSNAAIIGLRPIGSLTQNYASLTRKHGVTVIHAEAKELDPIQNRVVLSNGTVVAYEKLVLSPGIDINTQAIRGYTRGATRVFPHAWIAGQETEALRTRLHAMKDGGLVVISVPPTPYRCPPGPYERASLFAYYLKLHKPKSKVLILDANNTFTKGDLFLSAWKELYPEMVEWVPLSEGGEVIEVDAAKGVVRTHFDEYKPALGNIIPPQTASRIARVAGLDAGTGWCSVNPATFESLVHKSVYVIGDAALANPMPKSAFSANSQAKVCAAAIVAALRGRSQNDSLLLNTCYSLVTPDYGISITAAYRGNAGQLRVVPQSAVTSPADAPASYRALEATYAKAWYSNIVADTFH